jgi:hypothetical protein
MTINAFKLSASDMLNGSDRSVHFALMSSFWTGISPPRYSSKSHGKFLRDDDDKLRCAINRFGTKNWSVIAAVVPGKTARQCKERWSNYLSPQLNSERWTPADDELLMQQYGELGNKWVKIARSFPNRTDTMVKNRFNKLQRRDRKCRELWIERKLYLIQGLIPVPNVAPPEQDIAMMIPDPFREEETELPSLSCDSSLEHDLWNDQAFGDRWQPSLTFSNDW